MTARDELPEGWKFGGGFDELWWAHNGQRLLTDNYFTKVAAIAAAWRIVDAEKEAKDG